jgi:hypothetical protein
MMQREHRNEATGVLPATFPNEAIRIHPVCRRARSRLTCPDPRGRLRFIKPVAQSTRDGSSGTRLPTPSVPVADSQ